MNINNIKITHQRIDGEVVIINLENGTYYSLRGFGADVWQQIESGRSRNAILSAVTNAYPERADASGLVGHFIDKLLSEELVLADQATAVALDGCELPREFSTPELEMFTDMQELIMIDVIHEVDSRMGWPHKPSGT